MTWSQLSMHSRESLVTFIGGCSSQMLGEGYEMDPHSIYAPHSVENCFLTFQAFFWRNHRIIMFTKAIRMMMIPRERKQKHVLKESFTIIFRPFHSYRGHKVAHVKRGENWFTRPDLSFKKDDFYFLESLISAPPPANKCILTLPTAFRQGKKSCLCLWRYYCARSKLANLNHHILRFFWSCGRRNGGLW